MKWEDSNPGKSWRTEQLDSILWPQWLFDSVNPCAAKTHCKGIPDLHTYFAGRGWAYYFGLSLYFCVWILTLNIWKTAQHTQKGPVKLKNCKKSIFERSWSTRATLHTLSKLCKTTWVGDNYHQGKLYSLSCHITINQAAIIIIYLAKPLSRQFAICC